MELPKSLSTKENTQLKEILARVKTYYQDAESGHDWLHINRVWNNALQIVKSEKANAFVVCLGVLFHDIADPKFYDGDTEIAPKLTRDILEEFEVAEEHIQQVLDIVVFSSFSASKTAEKLPDFIEFKIVQDADRLDAIGAIGIARTFNYGGYKNSPLYLPGDDSYNNSTIQHFYDKLFLLKDLMNTNAAKEIASKRHEYMLAFVKQFKAEWEGKA